MKRIVVLLAVLLAAVATSVLVYANSHTPGFVVINDTKFRAVYLVPDPDAAEATVHLIVQAGELENDGPEGMAHYVEHLAWLDVFQQSGQGADRHASAYTNGIATVYWESFRPSELGNAIGRISKVLDRPTLDANFAIEERDIVQREYDFRVIGDPYADIMTGVRQSLFAGTPYGRSVIGTPDSIAAMTVEEALVLFDQSHSADNAVLVIYGDITERQVVRTLGGGLLAQPSTPTTPLPDLPIGPLHDVAKIMAEIAAPTLIYQKLVRRPTCGTFNQCDAAVDVLLDALDSALDGGLAGPLRFDNFLARSFGVGLYHVGDDGLLFQFNAETDVGVTPEELHAALMQTLAKTAQNGLPIKTFEKVQERGLSDFDTDNEQPLTMRSVAISSASIRQVPVDLVTLRRDLETLRPQTVSAILDAIIGEGRTVIRYIYPNAP